MHNYPIKMSEAPINYQVVEENTTDPEHKPKILMLGKLPPPFYGPAIATEMLLSSDLSTIYDLKHINTGTHDSLSTLGRIRIKGIVGNIFIYIQYLRALVQWHPQIALVPLSQGSIGIMKDSVYLILGSMFRCKVVAILRGSEILEWYERAPGAIKRYYLFLMKRLNAVLVLSDRLQYIFKGFLPDDRILTVTNGADFILPKRSARSVELTRIVYLSNLQSSKGIEDLIQAANFLRSEGKAFKLEVAGSWRDEATRRNCMRIVDENKLPVQFHSPLTSSHDKMRFMVEADIFVFVPRRPEGQPWVVIEALAAGLPIIATDKGAICDMVRDRENGFIVKGQSPEEIADKLSLLIDDESLRRKMGKRSKEIYDSNYTERHMVQSFQLAFDLVLGR